MTVETVQPARCVTEECVRIMAKLIADLATSLWELRVDFVLLAVGGVWCVILGRRLALVARRDYTALIAKGGRVVRKLTWTRVIGIVCTVVGAAICVLAVCLVWDNSRPLVP
jgi:hypothetical protein